MYGCRPVFCSPLLACMYKSARSYSCHLDVGVGVHVGMGMGHTLKFYNSFYVMGKALSGKLSYMWNIWLQRDITFVTSCLPA